MSAHHLGETFDIHGGGLDLIFPHHENEIAQSCCAHGTEKMANTWLHNGFVQVEGRKMSKSEGNFVTIHDVLNTEKVGGRKWPGEVVRLALLMTHYREPLDFSVKRLEEAENLMAKWPEPETSDTPCPPEVFEALLDDLNTPAALQGMQRLCGRDTAAFAAAAAVLGVSKAAVPSVELSPPKRKLSTVKSLHASALSPTKTGATPTAFATRWRKKASN